MNCSAKKRFFFLLGKKALLRFSWVELCFYCCSVCIVRIDSVELQKSLLKGSLQNIPFLGWKKLTICNFKWSEGRKLFKHKKKSFFENIFRERFKKVWLNIYLIMKEGIKVVWNILHWKSNILFSWWKFSRFSEKPKVELVFKGLGLHKGSTEM